MCIRDRCKHLLISTSICQFIQTLPAIHNLYVTYVLQNGHNQTSCCGSLLKRSSVTGNSQRNGNYVRRCCSFKNNGLQMVTRVWLWLKSTGSDPCSGHPKSAITPNAATFMTYEKWTLSNVVLCGVYTNKPAGCIMFYSMHFYSLHAWICRNILQ